MLLASVKDIFCVNMLTVRSMFIHVTKSMNSLNSMIQCLCHSTWKMLSFWICWRRCLAWLHHRTGQLDMALCLHCLPQQCTAHPWYASLRSFHLLWTALKVLWGMIRYCLNYQISMIQWQCYAPNFVLFEIVSYPWNCNKDNWKTSTLSGPKWSKLKNFVRTPSIACFCFARWIQWGQEKIFIQYKICC